jgi:hypothetical protein
MQNWREKGTMNNIQTPNLKTQIPNLKCSFIASPAFVPLRQAGALRDKSQIQNLSPNVERHPEPVEG